MPKDRWTGEQPSEAGPSPASLDSTSSYSLAGAVTGLEYRITSRVVFRLVVLNRHCSKVRSTMRSTDFAQKEPAMTAALASRRVLLSQWHQHTFAKFELKDADAVLETMTDDPHVFCVPSGRGGAGKEGVHEFYAHQFLPNIPPDLELLPISEIFAEEHLITEYVMKFTHTLRMEWMLPGVPPTGRRAELLLVAIVRFENGKIASKHVYWDSAVLLFQLRVADSAAVAAGIRSATKLLKRAAQRPIQAKSVTLFA